MKLIVTLAFVGLIFGQYSAAHEGHNHAPGIVQTPHGGSLKKGKLLNFELLVSGKEVKVFPLTNEMKPILPSSVQLQASYQIPKKTKEKAQYQTLADGFLLNVDSKGAYRYELELVAEYRGKKETFKFQIEPQE